jgi:hypothetical protein
LSAPSWQLNCLVLVIRQVYSTKIKSALALITQITLVRMIK